ncbi:hypothetical protein [[Eubacterium] hominis]|uniref:hypothetical protein n=1 Tax=[Eubacterium] hominis TaxID=2764325 RepID=UPI003A4E393F
MIATLISNILTLSIFSYICHIFFENKYSDKTYNYIFLIFCALTSLIHFTTSSKFTFLIMLLSYYLLSLITFEGSIIGKLIIVFIFAINLSACELITLKSLLFFYDKSELTVYNNSFAYLLGVVLSNALLFIFSMILKTFYKNYKLNYIPKFSWLIMILPITTICLILSVNDYYQMSTDTDFNIIILIGLLLSNLVSIYVFHKTITVINKEKELQYELLKGKMEYETVRNLLQQHNKFLHNIRNQTRNMLNLLEDKNYKELEKYILNIFSQTTRIYNMINSDYEVIDAIINDKIQDLEDYEITIRVRLESTNFACKSSDLEKLFRILLDNAILECQKLDSHMMKNIIIKSKQINDQVAFNMLYTSYTRSDPFINNQEFTNLIKICDDNHLFYWYEYDVENKVSSITILFNNVQGDFHEKNKIIC